MRVDHNLQEGGQLRRRSLFSRTATIFLLSAIILFLATTATGTTKSDLSPATEQRDLDQSCRPIHPFNIHVDTDANIDADTDINHNPLKILKRKHDDTTKSNIDIDTPLPTQTQAQTEQHPFPASLYGTPGHAIASGLFVGMAGTCILWVVGFVVKT
ncbi:hypothetical protein NEMBOFW57_003951 [Staphylotrichum longicolle]|uniref:Uncharacterized protein n=1 Tax=Staphylotrichum longicolle TaxID=669026 RepID=A0AAD4F5W0_9PEZI|nr:hypothetical protein NEMBOFW57_003951 [Staphylotrichum longicolle]